jgi:AcrR family transcriptional regulator
MTQVSGQPRRARRRTGRRSGDSGTREAILEAARQQFAGHGYDKATIRGIAAAAGVDPALVHHYFGAKERLFTTAMRLPVVPSEIIASIVGTGQPGQAATGGKGEPARAGSAEGTDLGERMVRSAVGVWDSEEVQASFIGLLRSALTNEKAAAMLREFVTTTIIGTIARAAGVPVEGHGDEARYRASLAASQMIGLAVARYVLKLQPVASATPDELAVAVGPTLQRYLTGDLTRVAARTPDAAI